MEAVDFHHLKCRNSSFVFVEFRAKLLFELLSWSGWVHVFFHRAGGSTSGRSHGVPACCSTIKLLVLNTSTCNYSSPDLQLTCVSVGRHSTCSIYHSDYLCLPCVLSAFSNAPGHLIQTLTVLTFIRTLVFSVIAHAHFTHLPASLPWLLGFLGSPLSGFTSVHPDCLPSLCHYSTCNK